jgi:tetratricopeptide (TPR) repeat protein
MNRDDSKKIAEETIAEQNVERLLSRVYTPQSPEAPFAERVREVMQATAAKEARTRGEPVRTAASESLWDRKQLSDRAVLSSWAVAGAIILGIFVISRAFSPSGTETPVTLTNGDRAISIDWNRDLPELGGAPYVTAVNRPVSAEPERVQIGQEIHTKRGERRRVVLPDGSVLYIDDETKLRLDDERRVTLSRGRIFLNVSPREESAADDAATFIVNTPDRQVSALGTRFAVDVDEREDRVLVTQGKVKVEGLSEEIHTGQQVTLRRGAPSEGIRVTSAPRASHALAWTKDLMAAAEAPLLPENDFSGGALMVDHEGEKTRFTLRKYHVDVHIEDGFARTTIDQTYFNHLPQRLQGTFYFPLPPDASISRLAMYVAGKRMEGGMLERNRAREVFEAIKYRMQDPALLEWIDGSTFKMRVFPLEGRQEKRIILSYTQRLDSLYGRTSYRFPAGHNLGVVDDWTLKVHVRGHADKPWTCRSHEVVAQRNAGNLTLAAKQTNTRLDHDVVIDLYDAGYQTQLAQSTNFSSTQHENSQYLMLRHRPKLPTEQKRQRRDWVFLFESSGDRNPLLARAQIDVIRGLLENAEHDDTFIIVTASTQLTRLTEKQTATGKNIAAAIAKLEKTHLVGALDLAGALRGLKPITDSLIADGNPHLVHVGSGVPIMGERDAAKLAAMLPEGVRYVGIGVGKRWSRALMKQAAARTGGYYTQINPDEEIAWRAFDLLATLNTPRLLEVQVKDSAGRAWLCDVDSLAQGETLAAVIRWPAGKGKLPRTVIVTGKLNDKPFSQEFVVNTGTPRADYLPRTWAKLEIDRMLALDSSAHREAIVKLSKAMYVMSPYTSLLVLENEAMYKEHKVDRGRSDHWALYPAPDTIKVIHEPLRGWQSLPPIDPPKNPDPPKKQPERNERKGPSAEDILRTIVIRSPSPVLVPAGTTARGSIAATAWDWLGGHDSGWHYDPRNPGDTSVVGWQSGPIGGGWHYDPRGNGGIESELSIASIQEIFKNHFWYDGGGPGRIEGFEGSLSLVISQAQQLDRDFAQAASRMAWTQIPLDSVLGQRYARHRQALEYLGEIAQEQSMVKAETRKMSDLESDEFWRRERIRSNFLLETSMTRTIDQLEAEAWRRPMSRLGYVSMYRLAQAVNRPISPGGVREIIIRPYLALGDNSRSMSRWGWRSESGPDGVDRYMRGHLDTTYDIPYFFDAAPALSDGILRTTNADQLYGFYSYFNRTLPVRPLLLTETHAWHDRRRDNLGDIAQGYWWNPDGLRRNLAPNAYTMIPPASILLTDAVRVRPRGIAWSPDGKTLVSALGRRHGYFPTTWRRWPTETPSPRPFYESLLASPIIDIFGTGDNSISQIWIPKNTLTFNFSKTARSDRNAQFERVVVLDDLRHQLLQDALEEDGEQLRHLITEFNEYVERMGTSVDGTLGVNGAYRDALMIRSARQRGRILSLHQVERSTIPFQLEPPIIYPNASIWNELMFRRSKWAYRGAHLDLAGLPTFNSPGRMNFNALGSLNKIDAYVLSRLQPNRAVRRPRVEHFSTDDFGADGDLLKAFEQDAFALDFSGDELAVSVASREVREQQLLGEVEKRINDARRFMSTDPDAVISDLKELHGTVKLDANVRPVIRNQLLSIVEAALKTSHSQRDVVDRRNADVARRRAPAQANRLLREEIGRILFDRDVRHNLVSEQKVIAVRNANGTDEWVTITGMVSTARQQDAIDRAFAEHSSFALSPTTFRDLLSYAPGMNTSRADVLAVLESEGRERLAPLGSVDRRAGALLDKAKTGGWFALTLPIGKDEKLVVRFDLAGRYIYERRTADGLREQVICDGRTLWHLYPEIGVGAKRPVSRFHRRWLAALVPWLAPVAEDLARGADVRWVDERTIAIVPHGLENARSTPGRAVQFVETRLVFAEDGRLAERRRVVVPTGQVLLRVTYAADGSVAWLNGNDKQLASAKLPVTVTDAPNLRPAVDRLVVVPMPLRTVKSLQLPPSPDPVVNDNPFGDGVAPAKPTGGWDDDTAIAMIVAHCASGRVREARRIIGERFYSDEVDDSRLGFNTLLLAGGRSDDPAGPNRQRVDFQPEDGNVETDLKDYLVALVGGKRATADGEDAPVASSGVPNEFVRQLSQFHNLNIDLQKAKTEKKDEIRRDVFDRGVEFVNDAHSTRFAWAVVRQLHGLQDNPEQHAALAAAYERFESVGPLAGEAVRERAHQSLAAGDAHAARGHFDRWYAAHLAVGVVPRLSAEFYQAHKQDAALAEWRKLVDAVARLLKTTSHPASVVQLAGQCRDAGDEPLADKLVIYVLAGVSERDRLMTTLAAVRYYTAGNSDAYNGDKRAAKLVDGLLEDERLARWPSLWQLAATMADRLKKPARALTFSERALELTYKAGDEKIELEALRRDYNLLMDRYAATAKRLAKAKQHPPRRLVDRLVRAADRWRSLEVDVTAPCQRASQVLRLLGEHDLAWQYLTTPLAMRPNEAQPWNDMAVALRGEGDIDLAALAYDEAFTAEETNAQILWDHAEMLEGAGRKGEAQALYGRIAKGPWGRAFHSVQNRAKAKVRD